LAGAGFDDWAGRLPKDSASDLVDLDAGAPVRWVQGEGWIEGDQ
jgi:hypothetical protein